MGNRVRFLLGVKTKIFLNQYVPRELDSTLALQFFSGYDVMEGGCKLNVMSKRVVRANLNVHWELDSTLFLNLHLSDYYVMEGSKKLNALQGLQTMLFSIMRRRWHRRPSRQKILITIWSQKQLCLALPQSTLLFLSFRFLAPKFK